MMRNPFSAIGRGMKGFTMRWSGQARPWWAVLLPRTRFDYAKEIGDGSRSNIVVACVNWIARTFPEAPLIIVEEKPDGSRERVPGHEMVKLIEKPNPYYSGALLWKATVSDLAYNGNAYWLKVRSQAGKVVQLWWAPSFLVEPKWPDDGLTFISHYEYKPDPLRDPLIIREQDVVHFRDDIDPDNLRKGRSQLQCLMREIFTDEEAANLTASLMRNLGIPGVVLSPKGPGAGATPEAAEKIKEDFMAKFGGDKRGEPMIMTAPTDVSTLSFSPEQMDLRNLRRVPEERVTAVFGVAAVVVGLGAGLDRSTFTNFHEAREAAYEGNIIPTQRLRAADLRTQLLPDFDKRPNLDVEFDLTRVRVLQPDADQLGTRWSGLVNAGIAMVSDARRAVGLPVGPEHDIFIRPLNMTEVPAGGSKAMKAKAVKAAKARSAEARRRLARAYLGIFEQAAARLVAKEREEIMKLARRILQPKALKTEVGRVVSMSDFVAANDAFYDGYLSDVEREVRPPIFVYGEAAQQFIAGDVGAEPGLTPAMTVFLGGCAAGVASLWVSSSRGQVRSVAADALAAGENPVEALGKRFDEWIEKRPGKFAERETIQVGNAVAKETYRQAGIQRLVWQASGNACPMCEELDGATVEIEKDFVEEGGQVGSLTVETGLGHPPLHEGCNCVVVPG